MMFSRDYVANEKAFWMFCVDFGDILKDMGLSDIGMELMYEALDRINDIDTAKWLQSYESARSAIV